MRRPYLNFLNLLFPPRCVVCGEVTPLGTTICTECMQNLPQRLLNADCCPICGKPVASCVCREQPFYFSRCVSAFFYEPDTHGLIECLKMQPQSPVAEQVAVLMAEAFSDSELMNSDPFDAITEVPMSDENIAQRGHNQAKALAEKLAARLNVTYLPSPMICDGKKRAQHTLDYHERFKNARKSYYLGVAAACAGRILLIDDVMTTGATLDRCAQLLRECGASDVCCLTAATTLRRSDVVGIS